MDPGLGSGEERGGLVALPAFQVGGRVERTGLALVHEGEYIVPAAGSEAEISSATEQVGRVVNYYFPVEVEIVGELGPEHMEAVAQYVYDDLTNQLDGASQG
jgi:hypothetical protein